MDEIQLVEYDPRWPAMFDQEVARLLDAIGDMIVRIEHIGSTAIPGIEAKPIIDILIGVTSIEAVDSVIPELNAIGYQHWKYPKRIFFVKGLPPNGPRTHHLHFVELDAPDWGGLVFRDYLRAHSEEALHYNDLKRRLARQFPSDRDSYTAAKTPYVESVMRKATTPQIP